MVAILKFKEECVNEGVAYFKTIVESTRKEEGSIRYDLLPDIKSKNTFLVMERWKNMEALQLHFTTPHMKELMEKMPAMMETPASVHILGQNL